MPESEYDLELGHDDFVFRLKNPDRSKSGKYRIVLSNDAGDTGEDVRVELLGKRDGRTDINTVRAQLVTNAASPISQRSPPLRETSA